jgi:triacylglycerol lipase
MVIPRLSSPIVFVHGLLAFDRMRGGCNFFPGIDTAFRDAGNRVFVPALSPAGSVKQRAADLKAFLDREAPNEPVHLFGHSMGGLDCRYLISRLDMAPRVLSLTTVGTPHRGTSFADWGIRRLAPLVRPCMDLFGLARDAYYDLTTTNCRTFNQAVPDAPGVRYFSVAGRFQPDWKAVEWLLPYRIIDRLEGANDGLVSTTSAAYGEDCTYWDGDHVSLINWVSPTARRRGHWPNRVPEFAALAGRLADLGF